MRPAAPPVLLWTRSCVRGRSWVNSRNNPRGALSQCKYQSDYDIGTDQHATDRWSRLPSFWDQRHRNENRPGPMPIVNTSRDAQASKQLRVPTCDFCRNAKPSVLPLRLRLRQSRQTSREYAHSMCRSREFCQSYPSSMAWLAICPLGSRHKSRLPEEQRKTLFLLGLVATPKPICYLQSNALAVWYRGLRAHKDDRRVTHEDEVPTDPKEFFEQLAAPKYDFCGTSM